MCNAHEWQPKRWKRLKTSDFWAPWASDAKNASQSLAGERIGQAAWQPNGGKIVHPSISILYSALLPLYLSQCGMRGWIRSDPPLCLQKLWPEGPSIDLYLRPAAEIVEALPCEWKIVKLKKTSKLHIKNMARTCHHIPPLLHNSTCYWLVLSAVKRRGFRKQVHLYHHVVTPFQVMAKWQVETSLPHTEPKTPAWANWFLDSGCDNTWRSERLGFLENTGEVEHAKNNDSKNQSDVTQWPTVDF